MHRAKSRICLAVLLATCGFWPASASGQPYCPENAMLNVWEPSIWFWHDTSDDPGQEIGNSIIMAVWTGLSSSQGYDYLRYRTLNGDLDYESFGDCTREYWDNLAIDSGITFVNSHGTLGAVAAAYAGRDQNDSSLVDAWIDGDNMIFSKFWETHRGVWGISCKAVFLWNHWRVHHDNNRAIVAFTACTAFDWSPSVLGSCGGTTRAGFTGQVPYGNARDDLRTFFNRMNGRYPLSAPGTKRNAIAAYSGGDGYSDYFKMSGGGSTTLCPAPGVYYPVGPGQPSSGMGAVEFDSHCKTPDVLTDAVSFATTNATIENVRWLYENEIRFDYDADDNGCLPLPWAVTVTVHRDKIVAKDGGQQMDSDRVAPNNDVDLVWTFSGSGS